MKLEDIRDQLYINKYILPLHFELNNILHYGSSLFPNPFNKREREIPAQQMFLNGGENFNPSLTL